MKCNQSLLNGSRCSRQCRKDSYCWQHQSGGGTDHKIIQNSYNSSNITHQIIIDNSTQYRSLPKQNLKRLIEKANSLGPKINEQSPRDHLEHCLHNLVRIAYQGREGISKMGPQKSGQFGLNIGRAQEILDECPGITGGVDTFWRFFKKDLNELNYNELMKKALFRISELQLELPNDSFLKS